MVPAVGTRIEDLTLVAPLGGGAQGSVWRARRGATGESVAVKIAQLRDARDAARATREARALAHLEHPSLPRCSRVLGGDAGWIALELELVQGTDLGRACARLDLNARRLALRHVARALAHLHAAGVVHRDVKPANIVVADDFAAHPHDAARCKLVDLGIAIATGNPAPLTDVGHPGTLPFMAPEALLPSLFPAPSGKPTLDVFSFGVTGWVGLRGRHPSGLSVDAMTQDLVQVYLEHADTPHLFVPPDDVSDPFERVLAACLRLRADDRPRDAATVITLFDAAFGPAQPAPASSTRPRGVARPTFREGPASVAPTLRDEPVIPSPPRARSKSARGGTRWAVGTASLVALGALLAGAWLAGRWSAKPGDDATSTTLETARATTASAATPDAPAAAGPAQAAVAAEPPDAWASVGESNVRHSTVLGCETKVLAGWFRARCVHGTDELTRIAADPADGARISTEAGVTTLLVPLRGKDMTFAFEWRGRGSRTLHLVGHVVEHRTITSQGEFSAP